MLIPSNLSYSVDEDLAQGDADNPKSNGTDENSGKKGNKDTKGTSNKKESTNDGKGKDNNREGAYIQKNDGKRRGPAGPSILKRGNKTEKSREDSKGNPIVRGGKKHKINFTEPLVKVNIVENWKEHNAETQGSSSCYCNIF